MMTSSSVRLRKNEALRAGAGEVALVTWVTSSGVGWRRAAGTTFWLPNLEYREASGVGGSYEVALLSGLPLGILEDRLFLLSGDSVLVGRGTLE